MKSQLWKRATIVPALLAAIMPSMAYGDELPVMTAKDLSEFCQSKDIAVHNACKFFILGVYQTISVVDGPIQGKRICIPDNLSGTAMEFAVRDTMARDFEFYPTDKSLPAISVVFAIIAKKFPCAAPK
jgi:hypothetical protein